MTVMCEVHDIPHIGRITAKQFLFQTKELSQSYQSIMAQDHDGKHKLTQSHSDQ